MKHRKTLLLGLCLCALGTQAQTVTVVLNDGTSTKWPADQIKEIYFAPSEESSEVFPTLEITPWNPSNFTAEFKNETYTISLDCYSSNPLPFLTPGVYTVGGTEGFWIGPDIRYSYVSIKNETNPVAITEGTMTISNEGLTYTFVLDFSLENGNTLKGTYTGPINALNQYSETELSNMLYNVLDEMEDGEVYVNFNDANWNIAGAIDFYCNPGDTTLLEGTYKLSDSKEPFTFSSKSYVETYNPWSYNHFTDGTILVTEDGENYNIEMTLVFEDERHVTYKYYGPITSGKSSK